MAGDPLAPKEGDAIFGAMADRRQSRPHGLLEDAADNLDQRMLGTQKRAAARLEPPPAERADEEAYFRFASVRSEENLTTKVWLHQLEPTPPGLMAVKSPLNLAVWSLVKALQSPLLRLVS